MVSVVGNMIYPEHMESVIAEGKADFASMARAIIADPDIAKKLAEGRRDEIIPCLRCFHCMNDMREQTGRDINFECAINPYPYKRLNRASAKNPKKILVIGGGPAGINAAFTAAQKGHDVTLAEKTGELGGLLKFSKTDTVKPDMRHYLKYLHIMLEKYDVNIMPNREATPEYVIYALGVRPVTEVYDTLKDIVPKVIPIGDCKKAGKISDAVYDAVYGVLSLDYL